MTDHIPADLTPGEVEVAREWATSYLNGFYKPCNMDAAARALTALLPPPPRPTLEGMTEEERHACQWMQADVDEEITAGTREEWVGQYLDRDGKWATICTYPTREEVARHLDYLCWDAYTHTRIIRRYVTTEEEA